MAFGSVEGLAAPSGVTPELEHWFAQVFAEIKKASDTAFSETHTVSRIDPVAGAGIGMNAPAVDYILFNVSGSFTSGGSASVVEAAYFDADVTGAAGDTVHQGQMVIAGSVTTQGASETITLVSSLYIAEPDVTVGTGDTVTAAATVYIEDAPTEAGSNYALWVDDGTARFDDQVQLVGVTGILVDPGSDIDATVFAVNVTDGPAVSWDESKSHFRSTGALTIAPSSSLGAGIGALEIGPTIGTGVRFIPGSDIDVDLITVGVTGAPQLWWDESADAFAFTDSLVFSDENNADLMDDQLNTIITIGVSGNASAGIGFLGSGAVTKQTVTGSRGGNAALQSVLTALSNYGLITDNST